MATKIFVATLTAILLFSFGREAVAEKSADVLFVTTTIQIRGLRPWRSDDFSNLKVKIRVEQNGVEAIDSFNESITKEGLSTIKFQTSIITKNGLPIVKEDDSIAVTIFYGSRLILGNILTISQESIQNGVAIVEVKEFVPLDVVFIVPELGIRFVYLPLIPMEPPSLDDLMKEVGSPYALTIESGRFQRYYSDTPAAKKRTLLPFEGVVLNVQRNGVEIPIFANALNTRDTILLKKGLNLIGPPLLPRPETTWGRLLNKKGIIVEPKQRGGFFMTDLSSVVDRIILPDDIGNAYLIYHPQENLEVKFKGVSWAHAISPLGATEIVMPPVPQVPPPFKGAPQYEEGLTAAPEELRTFMLELEKLTHTAPNPKDKLPTTWGKIKQLR